MSSQVQLCNLALDAAHARSSISSIGESSAEGQACARHYEPALEAVLRSAHWNFARKQLTLSLLKDATKTPPDSVPQPWSYEYAYPSDCLRARRVLPQMSGVGAAAFPGWQGPQQFMPAVSFIIGQDDDSAGNPIPVVLTNEPQAQLVYTVRVTNPQLFDAEFEQAFVFYLGSRLCGPLTGDKELTLNLFQQAQALTTKAAADNGDEGLTVIDQVPDWIRVRGFLPDYVFPPGSGWYMDPLPLSMAI